MDYIATPDELEEQVGFDAFTLRKYARDGKLKHAEKVCGRWWINATKEWPKLDFKREENGK